MLSGRASSLSLPHQPTIPPPLSTVARPPEKKNRECVGVEVYVISDGWRRRRLFGGLILLDDETEVINGVIEILESFGLSRADIASKLVALHDGTPNRGLIEGLVYNFAPFVVPADCPSRLPDVAADMVRGWTFKFVASSALMVCRDFARSPLAIRALCRSGAGGVDDIVGAGGADGCRGTSMAVLAVLRDYPSILLHLRADNPHGPMLLAAQRAELLLGCHAFAPMVEALQALRSALQAHKLSCGEVYPAIKRTVDELRRMYLDAGTKFRGEVLASKTLADALGAWQPDSGDTADSDSSDNTNGSDGSEEEEEKEGGSASERVPVAWGWRELASAAAETPLFFKQRDSAPGPSSSPPLELHYRLGGSLSCPLTVSPSIDGRILPQRPPAPVTKDTLAALKADLEQAASGAAQCIIKDLLDGERFPSEELFEALGLVHHAYWRAAAEDKVPVATHRRRVAAYVAALGERWGKPVTLEGAKPSARRVAPILDTEKLREQSEAFIQLMMKRTPRYEARELWRRASGIDRDREQPRVSEWIKVARLAAVIPVGRIDREGSLAQQVVAARQGIVQTPPMSWEVSALVRAASARRMGVTADNLDVAAVYGSFRVLKNKKRQRSQQ